MSDIKKEQEIKIPIGEDKFIYGTLRGSLENPLIIFVHGFTGHRDEHIFFNGARFFEERGISSFRFNLYDWNKDARKLEECTLSLHAEDLDKVVKFFRDKGVKKIFVIGHSFGGLTVLLSKNQDFDRAILWDASDNPAKVTESTHIKELDRYYVSGQESYGFTIGKAMVEENEQLKPYDLIQKFKKPIKIIVAGDGDLVKAGEKYFEIANNPKSFCSIPNAKHNFNEEGTEEKLFEETCDYLGNAAQTS